MSTPEVRSHFLPRRHLFRIGNWGISSYTSMLYLGIVLGVFAGSVVARDSGLPQTRFAVISIVLLMPALIGARLAFVLQNWRVFSKDPGRVWRRRDGGAMLYGGLLLSFAVSMPLLSLVKLPFWRFWDAASITMLVGSIPTRLGCTLNGCCAGRSTAGWLGVWLPNYRGEWQRRFPTPLLEAALALIILPVMLSLRHYAAGDGTVFLGVIASYGAGRIVLEMTRETTDPRRTTWVNALFSAFLLITGVVLLFVRKLP